MGRDRTVAVVTLGGTIACAPHPLGGVTPSDDPAFMAGVLADARLSATDLPGTHVISAPPLASAVLDAPRLAAVVRSLERVVDEGACGVVVTTGTDTLEEVAFMLDLLWRRAEPVVVVGAMRHGGLPGADGPGNLRDGLRVAAHDQARGMGCLVTLNGHIHQAWQVRKSHTSSLSAFESFVSGPVGSVHEDTVRITSASVIDRPLFILDTVTVVPPVALVTAALADDGRLLGVVGGLGYRGLVVETMGGGSVPPQWSSLLERLTARMPVVYSSRTGGGPTLRSTYGGAGAERDLRRIGMTPAGLLDGLKARLLLGLLLAVRADRASMDEVWDLFDSPTTRGRRCEFVDLAAR
ncbi:MAG TPA: asparaginase domain-containing protein [Amycolatopsis sp.]|uniref:asparaginase domain-containing protein n=1 Tax=Amycolatopsis sp. TaxID=37632 RepID=UPI002B48F34A|nr:asparaginase domain-containing protein [Amycolatopsis sp.]HKS48979.1 asparaginase domain-containing protein [Amycolatopsis sp.]